MLPPSYSTLAAPARLLHLLKLHTLPKHITLFAPSHRTPTMSNATMFHVPKNISLTLDPAKIAVLEETLLRISDALAPTLSPPFHGVPLYTTYPRPAGHIPDLLLSVSSAAKDAGALPHAGEAGLSDFLSRFLMSPASAMLQLAYTLATVCWRAAGTGIAGRPDFELVDFDQKNRLETYAAVDLKTAASLSNEQLGSLVEGIRERRFKFTIKRDFFKAPGGDIPYTYPRVIDSCSIAPERSTEELVLEQLLVEFATRKLSTLILSNYSSYVVVERDEINVRDKARISLSFSPVVSYTAGDQSPIPSLCSTPLGLLLAVSVSALDRRGISPSI